ncbi:TPA: adhesin [Escherichia coli]|uniref:adhesin n=1 Tax=Escherichia coli TaxID=562 RepID=UPI00201FE023|nr:adhesin [Escherichia coli]MCV5810306.1 adhesin [Escherichia coli]
MKMFSKNKITIAAISALLISGTAMAQTSSGSVSATGSFNAATCSVTLPNATASFGTVTNQEVNAAKAYQKIKSVTADQGISVTNCTTPASLTVATTNTQSNGYVYPALNEATGNQQRDFALWMKVGDKAVSSYNAPIELANGTYPIELQMIKISNNYNKNHTGAWSAQYTLTATYN